jgi:hypothetical protein
LGIVGEVEIRQLGDFTGSENNDLLRLQSIWPLSPRRLYYLIVAAPMAGSCGLPKFRDFCGPKRALNELPKGLGRSREPASGSLVIDQ